MRLLDARDHGEHAGVHHADRSVFAHRVLSSLMVLSTILILLRVYVRYFLIKSPGLDDALACIAYVFVMAQGTLEIVEVHHGEGRQIQNVPKEDLRLLHIMLPSQILLYFITVGLVRLSLVACLPRLHKNVLEDPTNVCCEYPGSMLTRTTAMFKRCVIVLGVSIAVVTIVFFFVFVFQCKPARQLWYPPLPAQRRCMAPGAQLKVMFAHGGLGVAFDFILLAMPLYLIYTKMIWSTQALKVMLIFSVGQLAFAMGIVRLVLLIRTDPFVNMTYHMVPGTLSAHAEVHVILWVACFHTLPPIVRLVSSKLGLQSTSSRPASTPKGTSSKLLSKLCVASPTKRKTWLPMHTGSTVATHIISTNRMSRVDEEGFELESQYGKDAIVKSTQIEVHTSPRREY